MRAVAYRLPAGVQCQHSVRADAKSTQQTSGADVRVCSHVPVFHIPSYTVSRLGSRPCKARGSRDGRPVTWDWEGYGRAAAAWFSSAAQPRFLQATVLPSAAQHRLYTGFPSCPTPLSVDLFWAFVRSARLCKYRAAPLSSQRLPERSATAAARPQSCCLPAVRHRPGPAAAAAAAAVLTPAIRPSCFRPVPFTQGACCGCGAGMLNARLRAGVLTVIRVEVFSGCLLAEVFLWMVPGFCNTDITPTEHNFDAILL